MYNDAIDLRDFYNSALGHTAQRIVRRYIRSAWPDTRGMSLAGIGYPIPYLRPFLEEAERVIALMPAQQQLKLTAAEAEAILYMRAVNSATATASAADVDTAGGRRASSDQGFAVTDTAVVTASSNAALL